MILTTRCRTCGLVIKVSDDGPPSQSQFDTEWPINLPCVAPHCPGRAIRVPDQDGPVTNVTAAEYYSTLHKMRSIDGKGADFESVRELLTTKSIVHVHGQTVGPDGAKRTVIDKITLEDGTVLHCGSSMHGACIYLVEPVNERSDMASDPDLESSPEDRGEGGWAAEIPDPNGSDEGPVVPSSPELDGSVLPPMPAPSDLPTDSVGDGSCGDR